MRKKDSTGLLLFWSGISLELLNFFKSSGLNLRKIQTTTTPTATTNATAQIQYSSNTDPAKNANAAPSNQHKYGFILGKKANSRFGI